MATSNSIQSQRLATILKSFLCPDRSGDYWDFKLIDIDVDDNSMSEIRICFIDKSGGMINYIIDSKGNGNWKTIHV